MSIALQMPRPLGCVRRRGLEAVRGSQRIYLEAYTSQLLVPKEQLVRRFEHNTRRTHASPPYRRSVNVNVRSFQRTGSILWKVHHCRRS